MRQTTAQMLQTLRDAGCEEDFIRRFQAAMEEHTVEEQLQMLDKHRSCILDKVHDEQKKLECFDFLRYALKRELKGEKTT